MALAPEWMSCTKESPSQGSRFIGRERERERGAPKYGRQLSFSHTSKSSYEMDLADSNTAVPFACSLTSPPAPPHTPASILGDPHNPSRVLNRSKSSPGFGSPKSKKKSPDRSLTSFAKPKPKPPKPPLSPTSYMKSQSQPNLLNSEKTSNWHQQHQQKILASSLSSSYSSSSSPSPLANSSSSLSSPSSSSSSSTSSLHHPPPSTSPPLPPCSPPLVLVPEIDKLKTLIPTTAMPPRSVRPKVMVGPPLPLGAKKPAAVAPVSSSINSISSTSSISSISSTSATPSSVSSSSSTIASPPLQPSSSSSSPTSLAQYFRKATSEPSLMHHKAQQDALKANRRAEAAKKALAARAAIETEKAMMKEAVGSKQPKRSNFFQHVIKQEETGFTTEDETPIGKDSSTESIPLSPPLPQSTSITSISSPPIGLRSPLPEDMEDEERFLRKLGWVPEEEDKIPVLDEEEMREVKVKISLSKGNKSSSSDESEDDESGG